MKRIWLAITLSALAATMAIMSADAYADGPTSFEETLRRPVDIRFEPTQAKPGETVTLKITIDPIEGFHTYPTVQLDAESKSSVNRFCFPDSGPVIFVGPFDNPPGWEKGLSKDFPNMLAYPGAVTWERKAVIAPNAGVGEVTVQLKSGRIETRYLVCGDTCYSSSKSIEAKLTVLPGGPVQVDPTYKFDVDRALSKRNNPLVVLLTPPKKTEVSPKNSTPSDVEKKDVALPIPSDRDYDADLASVKAMLPKVDTENAGFAAFVLTAMFWVAVTLLTPCVFPMIPITVSFFLKQGEKKQHNPLMMAFVYTLTIVVVLGVAALFFLTAFYKLSINPWINTALGLLFVFFALSLFGMYDIVLPSFLVRFTAAREGRGGYGGVIFMALSFSIVSFTCVAPFLGGFAGVSASGKFSSLQLAAGAFAFAGTFAAPFFLLALFPSLLKKMPKSGGWMNTIKVSMGFLELAAALKFFRTAELRWTSIPSLFTYDFVLSIWIIILFLAGLYLLNLYRLPHDEPQEHVGVTRLLFGIMSISIGLYFLPGLFSAGGNEKQRPNGTIYAWVDAFLLPEPSAAESVGSEIAWSDNLLASIEDARSRNDALFIDFTGITCTNCKLNEKQVFSQPQIKDLLKKFRAVQMYTDEIPAHFYDHRPSVEKPERDAEANRQFEKDVFRTEQLPLYVLLKPEPGPRGSRVRIVGIYAEGKINNVERFKEFLETGLEK